jgi:hypothetical protein
MLLFRSEDPATVGSLEKNPGRVDHIDRWSKAWRLSRGAVLSLEQAWRLADAWYRDRMSAGWRRPTADEAHELFRWLGLSGEFWRLS